MLTLLARAGLAQDTLHHQIGLGLPKLIQHVFTVDPNSYLINYRNSSLKDIQLRAGIDFFQSEKEDATNYFAGRLGADFILKKYDKWMLYSGMDLAYRTTTDKELNTDTQRMGAHLFFGIMYHIGKHFSISTEPYFFVSQEHFHDNDTFDPNQKNKDWLSYGLSGIGFLMVNFHF